MESDDDVRLYCDVDAFPEAEIAWLKSTPGEEEQVLTLGPELAITGVERGDAGKCGGWWGSIAVHCWRSDLRQSKYCKPGLYYCVAKNTRGLVNKSLELEVYCKFSIFL